jgi:hypothetical protein
LYIWFDKKRREEEEPTFGWRVRFFVDLSGSFASVTWCF